MLQESARVLMYSHDTFGLGHLRRCREIAHALVDRFKKLQVLIISGSSIARAFDLRARVDFIRIPSVIKLQNGDYTSLAGHIDLADTLAMRGAIIRETAERFRPHIFIVDKEPLGLRGELEETLPLLKTRGTLIVLGLREVLDAPEQVRIEWQRADAFQKIQEFYDAIWIYGSKGFWDPLVGLDVPPRVRSRIVFAGHLRRSCPGNFRCNSGRGHQEYILVTAGGGGDGGSLMRQVLAAREHDKNLDFPLFMILGPFMPKDERREIRYRASHLQNIIVSDFERQIEPLMRDARGIVSMGGYNTFCEILSFDKRALLVPRDRPRREQLIRATRAAELGLVDMLNTGAADDPSTMAEALRRLPERPLPSMQDNVLDLEGLNSISEMVGSYLQSMGRPVLLPANT